MDGDIDPLTPAATAAELLALQQWRDTDEADDTARQLLAQHGEPAPQGELAATRLMRSRVLARLEPRVRQVIAGGLVQLHDPCDFEATTEQARALVRVSELVAALRGLSQQQAPVEARPATVRHVSGCTADAEPYGGKRVASWARVLYDSLPMIEKDHGGRATCRQVVAWLRRKSQDTILNKVPGPDKGDGLFWTDTRGAEQFVGEKRVSAVLREARQWHAKNPDEAPTKQK